MLSPAPADTLRGEPDPHDDEAFVWLAIAYGKKVDSDAAKAAVDEALASKQSKRDRQRNSICDEVRALTP
jgi:hypothetical protein